MIHHSVVKRQRIKGMVLDDLCYSQLPYVLSILNNQYSFKLKCCFDLLIQESALVLSQFMF